MPLELEALASAARRARRRRVILRDQADLALGTIAVIGFFVLWEVAAHQRWIDPLFTSSPTAIASAFAKVVYTHPFWRDVQVSGIEYAVGFLLAIVIGAPLGIGIGLSRILRSLLNPFVSALYVTPRVALAPVFIVMLGIGPASKIAIVFLMAIFPIIINAQKAMHTLDRDLIATARSFAATGFQVFRTIGLPSSVPFLLTGLRLGSGQALVGVVVGELFASTAGLGYMLTNAGQNLQTAQMFVGVLIFAFVGVVLNALMELVEQHFSSWRRG